MLDKTKFTVIVPTRERANTLYYCLQTLVRQRYENFAILVSDNYSQDNTEQVVRSISDSRIRYINTGRRICMSRNFEFALSHVRDGWISYLGDDDGFLPNALALADSVIRETGCKALASRHHYYTWPSFEGIFRSNYLVIRTGRGYRIRNAKGALRQLLKGRLHFTDLPGVYRAFAEYETLNRLRDGSGHFFCSRTPDVYAGIALLLGLDHYVYSNEPLWVSGASAHSIGHSQLKWSANSSASAKNYAEEEIPFHQTLGDGVVSSVQLIVYDSFLQASHLCHTSNCTSIVEQLAVSIAEVSNATGDVRTNVTDYCQKIAECQGINFQSVKKSARRIAFRRRVREGYSRMISRFVEFYVDGGSFGLRNILDATVAANSLYFQATSNKSWRVRKVVRALSHRLSRLFRLFASTGRSSSG
jgi:glycosyltransferase involved in cell wall biosynthesis